jgi:hypothetical protein
LQRRETLRRMASGSLRLLACSGDPIPEVLGSAARAHIESGRLH